jgi:hypothetical protein
MLSDEALEPSKTTTEPARETSSTSNSQQAVGPTSKQQSNTSPSTERVIANVAQIPQLDVGSREASLQANISATRQKPERKKAKPATPNTRKNRKKSGRTDESDGEEHSSQSRAAKRQKSSKVEDPAEHSSVDDGNGSKVGGRANNNNSAVLPRPQIDSYRPSYASDQPLHPRWSTWFCNTAEIKTHHSISNKCATRCQECSSPPTSPQPRSRSKSYEPRSIQSS